MANGQGDTFQNLQHRILDRLIEVRGSIAPTYADLSISAARREFERVLIEMRRYFGHRDESSYRDFLARWMAIRTGHGDTPEGFVHTMVAIGEVAVQVAQQVLPDDAPETSAFVRQIVKLNRIAARSVVDALCGEWDVINAKSLEVG